MLLVIETRAGSSSTSSSWALRRLGHLSGSVPPAQEIRQPTHTLVRAPAAEGEANMVVVVVVLEASPLAAVVGGAGTVQAEVEEAGCVNFS